MRTRFRNGIWALAVFWASATLLHNIAAAQPKGSDRLSPEDVISAVLSRNPSLASIEEAAIAASARVEPAGALEDPSLSYALAPGTISNSAFTTGHRIDLGQSLPWPGKRAAREEAARQRARAARESRALQRLQLVAAAKAAFAEWSFVHDALRLNRENTRLVEDLRASAEARFASGRGLQQDVLRAEVEIALLQDRHLDLQQEREAVQARLNALMNEAPGSALPRPVPLPAEPVLPALPALIERASAHHPELRILEHRVAETSADIRLAEKEFYPDFRASAGYNSLWAPQDKRWTFGFSVNIPLDRSRREAEVNAARADRRRAEWRLADRRNALLSELVRLHAEATRAAKAVDLFAERLLPLSAQTLEVSLSEYESGAGDFLDVIAAERNRLEIETSALRAAADRYRARAELEFWVGGALEAPSPNAGPARGPAGGRQ